MSAYRRGTWPCACRGLSSKAESARVAASRPEKEPLVPENPQKKADPVIVFGAFDRHNFGDLLFPHIAMNLLALDDAIFAGLAARDLRDAGGFAVEALAALAARHRK